MFTPRISISFQCVCRSVAMATQPEEDQCLIDPLMHLAAHSPQVAFVSRSHFRDMRLHKSIYFCKNQSLSAVFALVYWQQMWCKHRVLTATIYPHQGIIIILILVGNRFGRAAFPRTLSHMRNAN